MFLQGHVTNTQHHIDSLFNAFESYYHPSNVGKWSVSITLLTDGCGVCIHLISYINKIPMLIVFLTFYCRAACHVFFSVYLLM